MIQTMISTMSLEAKKLEILQYILEQVSEDNLDDIQSVIDKNKAVLKSKLIKRALRAQEDIKNGNVHTMDEVNARLQSKFGI